jgi:hypothetical protein
MSEYYIKMLNSLINMEIFERDMCILHLENINEEFKKIKPWYFFTLDALWYNVKKTKTKHENICKKIDEYKVLLNLAQCLYDRENYREYCIV